jgi:hypothetical protein
MLLWKKTWYGLRVEAMAAASPIAHAQRHPEKNLTVRLRARSGGVVGRMSSAPSPVRIPTDMYSARM